eukprot:756815-Prorocentrum_minimum.AAC.1
MFGFSAKIRHVKGLKRAPSGQVAAWVENLGLPWKKFKENSVSGKDLPHLTTPELEVGRLIGPS